MRLSIYYTHLVCHCNDVISKRFQPQSHHARWHRGRRPAKFVSGLHTSTEICWNNWCFLQKRDEKNGYFKCTICCQELAIAMLCPPGSCVCHIYFKCRYHPHSNMTAHCPQMAMQTVPVIAMKVYRDDDETKYNKRLKLQIMARPKTTTSRLQPQCLIGGKLKRCANEWAQEDVCRVCVWCNRWYGTRPPNLSSDCLRCVPFFLIKRVVSLSLGSIYRGEFTFSSRCICYLECKSWRVGQNV